MKYHIKNVSRNEFLNFQLQWTNNPLEAIDFNSKKEALATRQYYQQFHSSPENTFYLKITKSSTNQNENPTLSR